TCSAEAHPEGVTARGRNRYPPQAGGIAKHGGTWRSILDGIHTDRPRGPLARPDPALPDRRGPAGGLVRPLRRLSRSRPDRLQEALLESRGGLPESERFPVDRPGEP